MMEDAPQEQCMRGYLINMDRIEEFETRLEDLLGQEVMSNIMCDTKQIAYARALEYGESLGSTSYQVLLYQNLLDNVLQHYEAAQHETRR
jgi:hypothetical protein